MPSDAKNIFILLSSSSVTLREMTTLTPMKMAIHFQKLLRIMMSELRNSSTNDNNRTDNNNSTDAKEAEEESAEKGSSQLLNTHNPICANQIVKNSFHRAGYYQSMYIFFKPTPSIVYIREHFVHIFECAATHCKGKINGHMVHQYLDISNAKSISNICKHVKICWAKDVVAAADDTRDVCAACEALRKMKSIDLSITAVFEQIPKGKVTYSHHQHTTIEAW